MIETVFVISTAHLAPGTADAWLWPDRGLCAIPRGEEAWFIRVPEADPPGLPDDLVECLALARGSNCDWLAFDPDAVALSILPQYAAA